MQKRNWLSSLFIEKLTPENFSIGNLQRAALWIGLAMSLQALNEIGHDWFLAYLGISGLLVPFALYIFSFLALYQALRQSHLKAIPSSTLQHIHPLQFLILLLTLIFAFRGVYEFARGINQSLQHPPQYWNDGTSLDANAAYLLLEGRNPYTDSSLTQLAQRFSIHSDWTTPLRTDRFANRLDYPTKAEIQDAFTSALQTGNTREFEDKVSYPALSFLPFLPFALLNLDNVFPFYLVCYLLILLLAWRIVRPEMRIWALILGLANIPMWSSAVGGNIDILCFLFLLLAWLFSERRWTSALCMGLACATKQTAWFFVPFYLVMIWRNVTPLEALKRLAIAATSALLINAPFILWNPHAWLTGMLTPMVDPMFPDGVGIITFSLMHWLPYFPGTLYTALEVLAIFAALFLYWRICRRYPEAAMLLSVLPLFFAWRSLPSYFACAAYGIFILLNRQSSHNQSPQPVDLLKTL
jgi:Glycosyltransferase family 87